MNNFYSPNEIAYNFGGIAGKEIKLEGIIYTINYVKCEVMSRQLQAQMSDGTIVALNLDDEYEFVNLPSPQPFKAPTKGKVKGNRRT